MWKVINTANDRMKADLHRLASKFTYEPSIGGMRLRLGETMELDDEHFEQLREQLEGWRAKGMVEFERVGGEEPAAEPEPMKMKVPAPKGYEGRGPRRLAHDRQPGARG